MELPIQIQKFLGLNQIILDTIRSCLADLFLEKGAFSDFSRFSLRRTLGSKLIFTGFANYSETYLKQSLNHVDDVFNIFSPDLAASVLASLYVSRRAIRITKNGDFAENFQNFLVKHSLISTCFGRYIPEIGLVPSTLYGCIFPSSVALIFMFDEGEFKKALSQIERQDLNFSFDDRKIGYSIEQLGGFILQTLGFGKAFAEAYVFGLLDQHNSLQYLEQFANLHFWVKFLFSKDPSKFIEQMTFEMEEQALNNMLEEISNIKLSAKGAWFLPEVDQEEVTKIDDTLSI